MDRSGCVKSQCTRRSALDSSPEEDLVEIPPLVSDTDSSSDDQDSSSESEMDESDEDSVMPKLWFKRARTRRASQLKEDGGEGERGEKDKEEEAGEECTKAKRQNNAVNPDA